MLSSFSQEKTSKPKTLACYICGRQFGTKSLTLHLKPCKEKFKHLQDQKIDQSLKIKLPSPPDLLQTVLSQAEAGCLDEEILEKYNEQARNTHKYKVLPACKYCGRTFNEQSLASHMKACPKKGSYSESAQKDYGSKIPDQIKKPRTLVCCVCGRQLGITSLKIHYPQCQEKFRNEELKKPPKQRNPVPEYSEQDLELVNCKKDWTLEEINDFNQKASANFRNKAMTQCENCKRKFLPESYKRHAKNCKLINGDKIGPKSPSKQGEYPQSNSGYDIKEFRKPKVLMCHICGREFGLTSLKIHLKNCIEKFTNEELKRPKKDRRPVPQMGINLEDFDINFADKWASQKIQEYNQAANQVYKGCSLFPCPICGRKFFEDSLKRHLNYCQKNAEQKQLKEQAARQTSKQKPLKSPAKFQENASKVNSHKSHLKPGDDSTKKCDDLLSTSKTLNIKPTNFVKQQASEQQNFNETIKEVNEELEGTLKNTRINLPQESLSKNQHPIEQNSEQISINRVECSKCNRKFAEDRIQKHESICKGALKKVAQTRDQKIPDQTEKNHQKHFKKAQLSPLKMDKSQFKDFKEEQAQLPKDLSSQLEECPKCGKKFMPSKIQKHVAKCRDVAFKVKKKKEKESEPILDEQSQQVFKPSNPKSSKTEDITSKQGSVKKIVNKQKEDLTNSNLNQINANNNGLIGCKYCCRKFGSDRLQKHQNVCLKKKDFEQKQKLSERQKIKSREKASNKIAGFKKKQAQDPKPAFIERTEDEKIDLMPCPKCQRKFALDRLQRHENVCKGIAIKSKKQQTHMQNLNDANKKIGDKAPEPNKKNMFNIKPVNKKLQQKKQAVPNQKDPSHKDMVKENIQFTQNIMNQIWDTKEIPNPFPNSSSALQNQKMKPSIQKANKTAYDGGFYNRKASKQFSQDKDADMKLEQIDNVKRVECKKCGRNFIEQRIQKHEQICKGERDRNSSGLKRNFNRYVPQNRQKSSKKLIIQKQSSDITKSVILPESKDIIKTFKQIKNMKINESYIDKELDKQLEVIKVSKPLKEIKSVGFGVRNTYGGGEKFYSKKSTQKLQRSNDLQRISNEVPMTCSQNVSAPYLSKYLQPIPQQNQTQKGGPHQTTFTVKKWNK